jgi:hypothetical protein
VFQKLHERFQGKDKEEELVAEVEAVTE